MPRATNLFDFYGKPLNLKYQGHETYTTKIGVLLTVVTAVIFGFYSAWKLMEISTRVNPQQSSYTELRDLLDMKEPLNMADNGMELRLANYDGAGNSIYVPPDIAIWRAIQVSQFRQYTDNATWVETT